MGRTLEIETLEAYLPLLEPARYKGVYGGRGSAKSHFFAELMVEEHLAIRGHLSVCIREHQVTLEQSVKRLLESKIRKFGVESEFRVYDNQIATKGDGLIIFQGMKNSTSDSIKSLEGFKRAWVEEAQTLTAKSLSLLRPTIRAEDSELWFSWNPKKKTDPVDELLRGPIPPPRSIVLGTTYRDNLYFPAVLREEMEYDRRRDPEKYKHVWLGEYETKSEARVFKNWRVAEGPIPEPPEGTAHYLGGDWGYSIDPAVLIRFHIVGKTIYITRECYRIGVEIDHLPRFFDTLVCRCPYSKDTEASCGHPMHGWARQWLIKADSSRPDTISYLNRHGYPRVEAAKKGKDSVKEGVIFLQGYDIVIDPSCVHTADEFTLYSYKTDPQTNEVIPVLEDKKNHVIDSARYAVENLMQPPVNYSLTWGRR